MTTEHITANTRILVAVDIAKLKHVGLIELSSGQRKKMIIRNQMADFQAFSQYLKSLSPACLIGFEPTGDYHRNLAYFLKKEGFDLCLVSSLAVARTRDALHNSWDKNDPKDAQVILHLMKTGVTQRYYDPVFEQTNDWQELSNVHHQISLRKTRLQHSLLNHYLPLYFPEAERFLRNTRSGWFSKLLLEFPTPQAVTALSEAEFLETAASLIRTKHNKRVILRSFYHEAQQSVGIPVSLNSQAVAAFRLLLKDHLELCRKRAELELTAESILNQNADYQALRSIPGIGPIIALTILAEAGDLRRFGHEKQFLKYCGLDLCTQQSGNFRGQSSISKRGNARLRSALWLAATVAIRMRENTFREKFARYIRADPLSGDLKRKAYTACTAKMARVVYSLVKQQQYYRAYQSAVTDGITHSLSR